MIVTVVVCGTITTDRHFYTIIKLFIGTKAILIIALKLGLLKCLYDKCFIQIIQKSHLINLNVYSIQYTIFA